MSTRLAKGGRLIDRSKPVDLAFNGKPMRGFAGDTLASALLANDQMLVGRSFKYHRPRGIVASGAEEPNALVNLGAGGRFEPNQRSTTTEVFAGMKAASQNHWPSLEFDVGVVNNLISRFLPGGFYYKTFMYPRAAWKHLFEPFIRRSAGLGKAPTDADADHYEHAYAFCDVVVAGGGMAGLAAALRPRNPANALLLLEQTRALGRAYLGRRHRMTTDDWVKATVEALGKMDNVTILSRCMAAGVYDHGYVLADEKVADHTPGDGRPKHRLWRIRAGRIIAATGAIERPLSFAGNDIPGVMLASAVRDFVVNFAVSPGDRTVVVTNNDDAYRTAIALKNAGLTVPCIVDARAAVTGVLPDRARALGIRVETGKGHRSGQGWQAGGRRCALHAGWRRCRPGRDRLRSGRDVRRLVARCPLVEPLWRQVDLGRGLGISAQTRAPAASQTGQRRRCADGATVSAAANGDKRCACGLKPESGSITARTVGSCRRARQAALEDVARLSERREGFGRAACGPRRL